MTCADAGRRGGLSRSPAKAAAAAENGKRGGRPRKYWPRDVAAGEQTPAEARAVQQ